MKEKLKSKMKRPESILPWQMVFCLAISPPFLTCTILRPINSADRLTKSKYGRVKM